VAMMAVAMQAADAGGGDGRGVGGSDGRQRWAAVMDGRCRRRRGGEGGEERGRWRWRRRREWRRWWRRRGGRESEAAPRQRQQRLWPAPPSSALSLRHELVTRSIFHVDVHVHGPRVHGVEV
jgi:hypothetical protein